LAREKRELYLHWRLFKRVVRRNWPTTVCQPMANRDADADATEDTHVDQTHDKSSVSKIGDDFAIGIAREQEQ
jgi:hypothetical protein